MKTFKFLTKNPPKHFNSGIIIIYEYESAVQPIRNAIVDAIRICNISNLNYEDYEHYFFYDNRRFKLKVIEVRRYRNPIFSYWIIRYKMGRDIVNLDESMVTTQLRLDEEQYRLLIDQTPQHATI